MDYFRNLYNQYMYIRTLKSGKMVNSTSKCLYCTNEEIRDKRIHVLAKGPSLNEIISYFYKDDDVFTLNYSFDDERIRDLKPKRHFIIDSEMGYDKDYSCFLMKE